MWGGVPDPISHVLPSEPPRHFWVILPSALVHVDQCFFLRPLPPPDLVAPLAFRFDHGIPTPSTQPWDSDLFKTMSNHRTTDAVCDANGGLNMKMRDKMSFLTIDPLCPHRPRCAALVAALTDCCRHGCTDFSLSSLSPPWEAAPPASARRRLHAAP